MTGETQSSTTETAESKLSVSVIPVKESKEEDKILMQSILLAEFVVDSEEGKQISENGERVEKKVVESASDIGASGNEKICERRQSKNNMYLRLCLFLNKFR